MKKFSRAAIKKEIIQKTNRWLYHDELQDESSTKSFLTKNLEIIVARLSKLKPYIEKYNTKLELILYADNNTDKTLTKKHINLLNKVGANLSVSFC